MKPFIRDVTLITQFHNAFFKWLTINQSRFATPAFESLGGHCVVRLSMQGLHKALYFALYAKGIAMGYDWQDIHWTLKTFEAFPVRTNGGYVDGLCRAECQPVYACRDALWKECVFEPFLAWVNHELMPPRWLARDRLAIPLTDAIFIDHLDPHWRVILQIWIEQDE